MTKVLCVFICALIICCTVTCAHDYGLNFRLYDNRSKRVCIIGAGVAGLSTARYLKEEGLLNFTVLEATQYVGGTWRFDPRVGTDENGLPLHTSMYRHLRTNLPKPTMELRGFPLPDGIPSFPNWDVYYNYLQAYAKHFGIEKHIQFLHNVISVRRVDNAWRVRHVFVKTNDTFEEEYDYVIVGNGHFSKPRRPNVPGENRFKGTIIHSHDYKDMFPYKGRKVLVVGAGPSGMDIGMALADIASKLIHSHHSPVPFKTKFPPNYVKKPDLVRFNETGAFFTDGSYEELDDVVYCTGFEMDYPFLDESSGLNITARTVTPLYKYAVNINQPTMLIMGLVVRACLVIALDAQARYATALVKGNFTLPSRDEMMQEWENQMQEVIRKGKKMSWIHVLDEHEDEYYEALSKESGIERVPPVMFKIRAVDTRAKVENLYTYRNYAYKIIDDNSFIRTIDDAQESTHSNAVF